MKILIAGGGGLGTVLAAYLAHSGCQVTLFVKTSQAGQYERESVQIEGAAGFSAPVRILTEVVPDERFDYLLLCVKARDTEAALEPLRRISVGAAVSFQNGVAKDEAVIRYLGRQAALGGLTYIAGTLLAPGHARASNPAGTFIGELDGTASERCIRLASAFEEAGLPARAVSDIVTLEWYKLAIFLRTALVSALTRLDLGALTTQPALRAVCAAVAKEVVQVAHAEGYSVPRHASDDFSLAGPGPGGSSLAVESSEAEMASVLDSLGAALRHSGRSFYPSLAQDIMAVRPTELEATAGDVLERAERHGLDVPALRVCTNLLRGIEAAQARR